MFINCNLLIPTNQATNQIYAAPKIVKKSKSTKLTITQKKKHSIGNFQNDVNPINIHDAKFTHLSKLFAST